MSVIMSMSVTAETEADVEDVLEHFTRVGSILGRRSVQFTIGVYPDDSYDDNESRVISINTNPSAT